MKVFGKGVVLFFATGAGSGYAPVMPGTVGSAVGIPLYMVLAGLPLLWYGVVVAVCIFAAIWLSSRAERYFGRNDPPQIVIDEVCGLLVTLIGLPATWYTVAAGFLIFRILDVLKPFPANRINNHLHGGAGIVLDDIVAGVYANALLHCVRFLPQ
ncbi:MAG: phosphatidylglycerophosphatase A [Desulfobacterota bacterium]|nr:phosphatidylglycerophosphatase A [Thermodesulfobacteriota bacterium]